MSTGAANKKKILQQQTWLNVQGTKLIQFYNWSKALCGAETSEMRSEIPRKFLNVLEKNEEYQLDLSFEKWTISYSQGENNVLHLVKNKEG
jgi:hypothetical protein